MHGHLKSSYLLKSKNIRLEALVIAIIQICYTIITYYEGRYQYSSNSFVIILISFILLIFDVLFIINKATKYGYNINRKLSSRFKKAVELILFKLSISFSLLLTALFIISFINNTSAYFVILDCLLLIVIVLCYFYSLMKNLNYFINASLDEKLLIVNKNNNNKDLVDHKKNNKRWIYYLGEILFNAFIFCSSIFIIMALIIGVVTYNFFYDVIIISLSLMEFSVPYFISKYRMICSKEIIYFSNDVKSLLKEKFIQIIIKFYYTMLISINLEIMGTHYMSHLSKHFNADIYSAYAIFLFLILLITFAYGIFTSQYAFNKMHMKFLKYSHKL